MLLERNDELITVAILRYGLLQVFHIEDFFFYVFNFFWSVAQSIFYLAGCMATRWQRFHLLVHALSIGG